MLKVCERRVSVHTNIVAGGGSGCGGVGGG
ncbi:hypothetical protein Hamer_G017384 [Homarus americanus]|uniref:Uncharacterized protein n=1 Tax=Homarus americanus TaxID=6706 RepID=A0A8J5JRZ6_HOMAM|nr:hypothetical protein Hamer_G017384 [Homarus americanus]